MISVKNEKGVRDWVIIINQKKKGFVVLTYYVCVCLLPVCAFSLGSLSSLRVQSVGQKK